MIASYTVPPIYAAFVWWFSTGAVLVLVGRSGRFEILRPFVAGGLLAGSLGGLALTSRETSSSGAYAAFTCTILLWGAQEIAFLAGWLTGPRPRPCPDGAMGRKRLGFALQAILYHELALLACGTAVVALTWNAPNLVGMWTFTALWVLRQSAKINLFLGVPVTNDELMPDAVRFLKSFFTRGPVSAFFPISVTLAIAALVIMIQRVVEVAVTPFDVVGLTLVSTLFALGVVEHWFMLLPLPAVTLWGWGMGSGHPPKDAAMTQDPNAKLTSGPPNLVVLAHMRPEPSSSISAQASSARQRLEDQFRQGFREQNSRDGLATTLSVSQELTATANGRTS